MDPRRQAKIELQFPVDVGKAAGDGPHLPVHGEGEADGVSRRGVGVLPDDQYFDVRQGLAEGAQDVRRRREDVVPGGFLRAQEREHLPEFGFHAGKGGRPVRGNKLLQWLPRKVSEAASGKGLRFQFEQRI